MKCIYDRKQKRAFGAGAGFGFSQSLARNLRGAGGRRVPQYCSDSSVGMGSKMGGVLDLRLFEASIAPSLLFYSRCFFLVYDRGSI